MGRRSTVRSPGGQLEMRAGAGYREEDALVAVMTAKATDLGEPDAVAVELDHLVEALGMAGDAQLHRSAQNFGGAGGEHTPPHPGAGGGRRAQGAPGRGAGPRTAPGAAPGGGGGGA